MKKSILTNREKEIYKLLIDGYKTSDIANILSISDKTVRNHISNVIQKLEVSTRYQAVIELIKMNEFKL
jgi:LuxR family transcriptional regulator of spore coat protein